MNIKVKICGITNIEDAAAAVEAGADIIGFVFANSPRRAAPETVIGIKRVLPVEIQIAGVFVNEDPNVVEDIADMCGLDLLQFHGEESPEYCARFGGKAVKAVRVKDLSSLRGLEKYKVPTLLLDTYVPGKQGGTGRAFDWRIAAKESGARPIILSGGLTPDNVAEAVRQVKPYGVDVSSGVEVAPGKKDAGKMRAFIINAKRRNFDRK